MKLTELIDELKAILKEHGNKETYFYIIDDEGELGDLLLASTPEAVDVKDDEIHIGIDFAYD